MNDVFCKIISGEIPSTKIYEDEEIIAILDISQATKGHTLVIPKVHCDSMLSCPKELLAHVMEIAQKIGQAQMKAFKAKGINILANCGEKAGQSVMHFHVHVIPRYGEENEGFSFTARSSSPNSETLLDVAKVLSSALK